jgi:hypothetical protein
MSIIICSQKKKPYGHGGAMVKDLIIQCEGWGIQDFRFAI